MAEVVIEPSPVFLDLLNVFKTFQADGGQSSPSGLPSAQAEREGIEEQ